MKKSIFNQSIQSTEERTLSVSKVFNEMCNDLYKHYDFVGKNSNAKERKELFKIFREEMPHVVAKVDGRIRLVICDFRPVKVDEETGEIRLPKNALSFDEYRYAGHSLHEGTGKMQSVITETVEVAQTTTVHDDFGNSYVVAAKDAEGKTLPKVEVEQEFYAVEKSVWGYTQVVKDALYAACCTISPEEPEEEEPKAE